MHRETWLACYGSVPRATAEGEEFADSTGTLTLTVTGMGVSGFSPVGGGDFVSAPSTCTAGPRTFRIKIIGPPRASRRR